MIIAKHFEFEAAHQLMGEEYGKCNCLHGHTYKLTIGIEGQVNASGWVMNFKDLKQIVNEQVIEKLDHSNLNDILTPSTAENLVGWIYKQINPLVLYPNKVKFIRLYETSDSYAEMRY